MKLGLFIILFVIIFGGSYIVTNKLNGTSAYVDETAQLVKDNQDDVVSRLEAKEQGMYYSGFPTCPWCVELLPVLDKELQADHGKAYTVDVRGKHYSDADNAIVKNSLKLIPKKTNYTFLLSLQLIVQEMLKFTLVWSMTMMPLKIK